MLSLSCSKETKQESSKETKQESVNGVFMILFACEDGTQVKIVKVENSVEEILLTTRCYNYMNRKARTFSKDDLLSAFHMWDFLGWIERDKKGEEKWRFTELGLSKVQSNLQSSELFDALVFKSLMGLL